MRFLVDRTHHGIPDEESGLPVLHQEDRNHRSGIAGPSPAMAPIRVFPAPTLQLTQARRKTCKSGAQAGVSRRSQSIAAATSSCSPTPSSYAPGTCADAAKIEAQNGEPGLDAACRSVDLHGYPSFRRCAGCG